MRVFFMFLVNWLGLTSVVCPEAIELLFYTILVHQIIFLVIGFSFRIDHSDRFLILDFTFGWFSSFISSMVSPGWVLLLGYTGSLVNIDSTEYMIQKSLLHIINLWCIPSMFLIYSLETYTRVKVILADFLKPTSIGTTWGIGEACFNANWVPNKMMNYLWFIERLNL